MQFALTQPPALLQALQLPWPPLLSSPLQVLVPLPMLLLGPLAPCLGWLRVCGMGPQAACWLYPCLVKGWQQRTLPCP